MDEARRTFLKQIIAATHAAVVAGVAEETVADWLADACEELDKRVGESSESSSTSVISSCSCTGACRFGQCPAVEATRRK